MPNLKLYYRSIVIKTAWYRHKNRQVDQLNRLKDLEMKLYFVHLIFVKESKSAQWKKRWPVQQIVLEKSARRRRKLGYISHLYKDKFKIDQRP